MRRRTWTVIASILAVGLPIYFALGAAGSLPSWSNALCWGSWASEKPTSCDHLDELAAHLPPCDFDFAAAAARATPAIFLQEYWHEVDCGNADAALGAQSSGYAAANSTPRAAFYEFVSKYGNPGLTAMVVEARDTNIHPGAAAASVEVELRLGRTPQWISYELIREGARWVIDYSNKIEAPH